jgi:hypothetical protein
MADESSSMPEPEDESSLTEPAGVYELRARSIPGGQVEVSGHATFQSVRVEVRGASRHGLVSIFGDLPPHGVQYRHDDPQVNGVFGEVDFGWLSRFWLSRTSTFAVIDDETPRPGVLTRFEGTDVGVSDTCGTVSLAGVPQLQLVWQGSDAPSSAEWVPDGYGSFTRLVERSRVSVLRHVEWTAVWRDLTVSVAAIRGETALVFAATGGVPEFEVPEIAHGANVHSGWSAIVPLDQLSLRSWTSTERPVGTGIVAGHVGLVRGRTALVGLPSDSTEPGVDGGIVAQKRRGETVTDDFVLHPRTERPNSPWEWRAGVSANDLTELREVTVTTTWNGETRQVKAYRDGTGLVYLSDALVDVAETTPFQYSVRPADPGELLAVGALF